MIVYLIIFLIISIIALVNYNGTKTFYLLMFSLAMFCSLRAAGVDRDYETYVSIYTYITNGYSYGIEPTYIIISTISELLTGSPSLIFVCYASLSIFIKAKFIKEWSPYILLSLLIYYSNIFFLHEMTQIRIGLASSIGFYSLKYLLKDEKKKFFLGIAVAILFHFSMAVFLLLPLFQIKEISSCYKAFYGFSIGILYFFHSLNIDMSVLIHYIGVDFIQTKYEMYRNQVEGDGINVNVFSAVQILSISITFFALYYSPRFKGDKRYVLITKIFSLGPLSLVAFSAIPGFSLRLSELFSVAGIILLPMLVSHVKQTKISYFLVIILSLSIFLSNLYYLTLVKAYTI